uniref:PNPLA domain-containing protein n=1 Tax=Panagrolaimus sp. JU765 TaxID=591449 RepID=A0AC34QBH2_9BILA
MEDDAVIDLNYNLSFSGCGFLCIYHAGVIAAIKEYAPQLTKNKICGASAGAIAAAGIVCNVCISKAVSTILSVITQAHQSMFGPLDTNFHLIELVRVGLDESLPLDAHILCTNKLLISLTRVEDGRNVIVDRYDSRDELIQAILCSCFIPGFCGFVPPTFRGEQYWDGGMTDNQPVVDSKTITVSPFSGESDICPPDFDSASMFGIDFNGTSIRFTSRNLFRIFSCLMPPSLEICSRMCRQGFEDALRFLTRSGLTPCARCLTVQSSALPLPRYKEPSSMIRKRNTSSFSLMNRARLGSECDMCFETVEPKINSGVTTLLFPSIVQKTLDDAKTSERWLLNYLYEFRVVRYTWRMMMPAAVPLQYILMGLRRIALWIASRTQLNAMVKRFKEMLLFVSSEIEKMYGPIVRLSCYVPVSDIRNVPKPSAPVPTVENKFYLPEDETNAKTAAADDDDSIGQLVDYCQKHDAVLAYYYTDENNQTQVCEIFDMEHPRRANCCHSTRPLSKERQIPPPIPENEEKEIPETDINFAQTIGSPVPAEDSGLSLTEDNPSSNAVNRRDACCSPVRQLNMNNRSFRGSGSSRRSAIRRYGPKISNSIPQSSCSIENIPGGTGSGSGMGTVNQSNNNIFSSDSDPDAGGEMFFISNRRKRTDSNDYDGDPEQSDTDQGSFYEFDLIQFLPVLELRFIFPARKFTCIIAVDFLKIIGAFNCCTLIFDDQK